MPLMSLEPPAKSCSGVRPLGGEAGATASWCQSRNIKTSKEKVAVGEERAPERLSLILGCLLLVLWLGLPVWPKQPGEFHLEEAM